MNKSFFLGAFMGFGVTLFLCAALYISWLSPQKVIERAANKAVDQQVENLKEKAKSKLQDYLK